jgi:hypothetical protein
MIIALLAALAAFLYAPGPHEVVSHLKNLLFLIV